MRLLFDRCHLFPEDSCDFKLGIGGFKHSKDHPWFGFDLTLYVIDRKYILTYVSNFKKYEEVIGKRYPRTTFKSRESK